MTSPAYRRTDAAFGLLLWILGGEFLPLAHLVMHEDLGEHTHDAHERAHEQGRAHPHPEPEDDSDPSTGPSSQAHGEGSFAHHDEMMAQGALAPPLVPPTRLGVPPALPSPWTPAGRTLVRTANARAPPV